MAASSVWEGWPIEKAAAWADALLAYDDFRPESEVTPMLRVALWHGFHLRGVLPELSAWAEQAARFEAVGVTVDMFVRVHEGAGLTRWTPEAERRCRREREGRGTGRARTSERSASAPLQRREPQPA
ncbi:hypothetical protein [Agrococcus beijingensis]|uniref:hypothetical protein n=1 Tax=Agrococcus beijingensis TaxID=3068634 RepID=UPI0027424713|nr:hypothetical protein [Agrococcus sp. REN33]